LWALLEIFARHRMPVDLAVIPRDLSDPLARGLCAWAEATAGEVRWHQHGFAHVNHEPAGRKCEFGDSRTGLRQRQDIARGRQHLEDLLGVVDPIFTPPWNRCNADTGGCLVELGFSVLSREARAVPLAIPGLHELPVNVDWFAHRKKVRLSRRELGELLARAIEASGPVGIMFHHAAMDGAERTAAADLLSLLASHERVRVHSMLSLAETQLVS